jgi:hypothetical protein
MRQHERPISDAQREANRANAQHSTGPRTDAGRAKVSVNAVRTALTGCIVLLPSDNAELYRAHIIEFADEFKPVGLLERHLVQSLADLHWRLNRIPGLEHAIYTKGRVQFEDMYPNLPNAERIQLIELEISEVYEKQLRNLRLHESRLSRRREKQMVELRALQQERKTKESAEEKEAAKEEPIHTQTAAAGASAAPNGFEFSNPVPTTATAAAPTEAPPEIALETAA